MPISQVSGKMKGENSVGITKRVKFVLVKPLLLDVQDVQSSWESICDYCTVLPRYKLLHCLAQGQVTALSCRGTSYCTVLPRDKLVHWLAKGHVSALACQGTSYCTVLLRYKSLHRLAKVQVSTLACQGTS